MGKLKYVVVSMPRAGTGYTAKVLSEVGLNCGHEDSFRPGLTVTHRKGSKIWGEASWLTVPFLSKLPSQTLVLHQTRDPIRNLDSIMARRQLRGKLDPKGPAPRGEYTNFLTKHVERWLSSEETTQDRLLRFWVEWHTRMEEQASNPKLRYFRFRLEDMNEELLLSIVRLIGASDPEPKLLQNALKTSKRMNHRRGPTVWAQKYLRTCDSEVAKQLKILSKRYGY